MNYFIGLDIGTSSVKAVLMTTKGKVVESAKGNFCYQYLGNGGVELNPKQYLEVCYGVLKELAGKTQNGKILAVCASAASGNLLLLGEDNEPITNIIGWQDQRVTNEAKELLSELDADAFYHQIGWQFNYQSFPLAQLCYIYKNQLQTLKECGMVVMSTEYLYYTLTGKWGISTSAGTPSYLIDQEKGKYNEEILHSLGIAEEMLPPIMPCGTILGQVQKEMEEVCGLLEGTPIVLGSFDHPSAARGVGVLKEGQLLLSCGTSWVTFHPITDRKKGLEARGLVDPFLSPEGCYGVMTSVASLSERLKQYVNRYIDTSDKAFHILSELAKKSVSGANGLTINPHDDVDDARIMGFPKEDIARAIMEGTVKLLKGQLDHLADKGIVATSAVMVGGPSEDPYWIELIEEICDISVKVMHGSFAGAVGAAVIAGIGVGEYQDEAQAQERFQNA